MLASVLLVVCCSGAPPSDWSDYKPSSVAKAWSKGTIVEGSDHTIEAANVKYLVEAVYTGEHRDLVPMRKDLFGRWAQALGHPPERATLCAHEVQIRAAKLKYWLPIQNALLEPFAREAVAGARLRLHIMYIGAVGKDRVFMVNRFEVLQP